ncbi:hypothetical protein Pan44_03430 [Caulifigura coniformis]|uniref:Uncharacterized protein n=1 Tax=Caulifigura coniformis TaxID=2527983 RepID=A0A517S883_9PLAN|nr:hypothetical protein Pan44_03430 [Caulifigura coniformis]
MARWLRARTSFPTRAFLRTAFLARRLLPAGTRSVARFFSLRLRRSLTWGTWWAGRSWRRRGRSGRVARGRGRFELVRWKLVFLVEPGDRAWLRAHNPLPFDQRHELRRVLTAAEDRRFSLPDHALAAACRAAPLASDFGREMEAGTAHCSGGAWMLVEERTAALEDSYYSCRATRAGSVPA